LAEVLIYHAAIDKHAAGVGVEQNAQTLMLAPMRQSCLRSARLTPPSAGGVWGLGQRRTGIPRMELMGPLGRPLPQNVGAHSPLVAWAPSRRLPRSAEDGDIWRRLIAVAWPASAQLVVRICAMLLTHSLVARAFTTMTDQRATIALGVVFRMETLALFVAMGWGSAAQTFLSQNLGARQLKRSHQSGRIAAMYCALMLLGLGFLLQGYGSEFVRFFDDEAEVVRIASSYLRIVSPPIFIGDRNRRRR
jgi:hypothetical protein